MCFNFNMDTEQKLGFPFCVSVLGTSVCFKYLYTYVTVLAWLAVIHIGFNSW